MIRVSCSRRWQVKVTKGRYKFCIPQVTGGRNGYGAKLANIFSTQFVIETCDGRRKRAYRQVFSANMTAKGEPQISPCKVRICRTASPHCCVDDRSLSASMVLRCRPHASPRPACACHAVSKVANDLVVQVIEGHDILLCATSPKACYHMQHYGLRMAH